MVLISDEGFPRRVWRLRIKTAVFHMREDRAQDRKIRRLARRGPPGRGPRAPGPRRRWDARSRRRDSGGPGSPRRAPRPRRDSPSRRKGCSWRKKQTGPTYVFKSKIVPPPRMCGRQGTLLSRTNLAGTSLCRVRGVNWPLQWKTGKRAGARPTSAGTIQPSSCVSGDVS